MLKIKAGVTPANLTIAAAIANVAEDLKLTLVITAGTDGKHMAGSRHYTGQALDLRTSNLTDSQRFAVLTALRVRLGARYDVVLEKDHLHIEQDH